MKHLSSIVTDMVHSLEAANFNFFQQSNQEKGDKLFAAFDSMHASVVTSIGDLIDASFRQATGLPQHPPEALQMLLIHEHVLNVSVNPLCQQSHR